MKEIAYAGALKLAAYLKRTITEDYASAYPHILPKEHSKEEILTANQTFYKRIQETPLRICMGNPVAETLVQLAFLLYLYPETERLFYAVSIRNKCGITLEVAAKVSGEEFSESQEDILEAYQKLSLIFLWENAENDITVVPFYVDYTLALLITTGKYIPEETLRNGSEYYTYQNSKDLPILFNDEYHKVLNWWQEGFWLVQVSGEKDSGRSCIIKNLAHKLKQNIIFTDAEYLFAKMELEERERRSHILLRDSFLTEGVICLCEVESGSETKEGAVPEEIPKILELIKEYKKQNKVMYLTTGEHFKLFPFSHERQFQVKTHRLRARESRIAWEAIGRLHGITVEESVLKDVAEQMLLPVGAIERVICSTEFQTAGISDIFELCFRAVDDGRFDGISRVMNSFTMDDLKLEDKQKYQIQEIIDAIRRQKSIFEQPAIKRLFPYGTSITALFSGQPGTGKTMAAHVIANEVHLPLFKVNLSEVMDKYIGESEKKLAKIFDQAENGNLILFFDEADALIGKRSEITDSRDRYANATVSYILQRIEELNGIVLMATNFSNNIDEAFMRRIQYDIRFTNPSEKIRRELWKAYLKDIEYEYIDFDTLASEDYNFSPAILKNIFLHAVFSVKEGECLSMKQIARSAIAEYYKMGRNGISDMMKNDAQLERK